MKKKILTVALSVFMVGLIVVGLVYFLGGNDTLTIFLDGIEFTVSATATEANTPLISAEEIFDVADVDYSYKNGKALAKGKKTLEIDTSSNSITVDGLIQQSEFLIEDDKLMIPPYLAGEIMDYQTISVQDEVRFVKYTPVTLKFRDSGKSITVPYCDDLFALSATQYNHSLAKLSLGLATSAFSAKEADANWGDDGDFGRDKDIIEYCEKMGFKNIKSYNYDKSLNDTSDKVAYVIAEKEISNNGKKHRLVVLAIRGGCYGNEWVSNFNIGNSQIHKGFLLASDEVVKNLYDYLGSDTSNTKLWLSGFSRGGAVAGITAARVTDEKKIKSENIYAYTFAAPRGTLAKDSTSEKYEHIFNIISENDLIPLIAPSKWGFNRYGKDVFLPSLLNYDEATASAESKKISEMYQSIISSGEFDLLGVEKSDQKKLNQAFIDSICTAITSKTTYTDKYDDIIMDFIQCSNTMTKNDNGQWKSAPAEEVLAEKYVNSAEVIKKAKENEFIKYAERLFGEAGSKIVTFGIICLIHDENPYDIVMNKIGLQNLATLASVFSGDESTVAKIHYPETYAAQLFSVVNPNLMK